MQHHARPSASDRASSATTNKPPYTFSQLDTHTHTRMRTRGESIYQQHAHVCMYTYKLAYARARNKARGRGRLVSAQLWRHPSRARILQASRDQPGHHGRQSPCTPAATASRPLLGQVAGSGSIIRVRVASACLHATTRSLARRMHDVSNPQPGLDHGSRPVWPTALQQRGPCPLASLEQIKPASPANGCPSRRLRAAAPSHMPRV